MRFVLAVTLLAIAVTAFVLKHRAWDRARRRNGLD